ncbi:MAG: type II toxin-antitoxin system Phd/YefM family antitoxin [Desulfobacterales bacterium]
MKKVNIVELKNNFSKILMYVEKGERIQVCKRNIPIAYIVPFKVLC